MYVYFNELTTQFTCRRTKYVSAVKILRYPTFNREEGIKDIANELTICRKIQHTPHPSLVQIISVLEEGTWPWGNERAAFIQMEFGTSAGRARSESTGHSSIV